MCMCGNIIVLFLLVLTSKASAKSAFHPGLILNQMKKSEKLDDE